MQEPTLKVEFPKGRIYSTKNGSIQIVYNSNYVNKFNTDLNKGQAFLDERTARYLQEYVSYKTGTQEQSIPLSTDYGSGIVTIGVPYARYQAYSKKIHKRVGKRGTRPFERMKADKKSAILRQTAEYLRRLSNGQ